MHVSAYREIFTFYIINNSGNVFKCSCSAPQKANICCLLGPIWCDLLCFGPCTWLYCLLFWDAKPWILDLVHPGPASWGQREHIIHLLSCHFQHFVEGWVNRIKPHSTFSHAIYCDCLLSTLWSPIESSDFPLVSGKVWQADFLVVCEAHLPKTQSSHRILSHRASEGKALGIYYLLTLTGVHMTET